ncbi:MAG TPA: GMC family oxidoreductase [Candidatus Sulfotelmatobacter sp.]|jgi:choline dehydrogenase-like flavoprotein|nr:GMC family oxidoreductase [Candidatus Sulfotelmatobacter sp.]
MSEPNTFDAIVVGSGITGGWAAKELTEKGLKTLVLEAGRNIVPEEDYIEHVPQWEMKFRGMGDRRNLAENQPIQSTCYACDEWSSKFFISDKDHPYTTDPGKPFRWIRGRQVGGRSIMWGRQSYRWSDLDFEANLRDGIAVDWPIRYADIAPWYDYVEEFAGISGEALGLAQLPDSKFLPPMELNCTERIVRSELAKHFGGERVLTIGRAAILTQDHRGRAACHYCGPCERGCITRSYFSSLNATLPAAEKTGRMTLRPFSVVHSVIVDQKTRRAAGVRVIDSQTKASVEFRAKVVFLCASALESVRILFNSATPDFSNGLANSSGELGHNLMDHVTAGGATALIPGNEDRLELGRRPNGTYTPRFRNVKSKHSDFLRGYGFQGGAHRDGWNRGITQPGFGADFKKSLSKPGPWRFSFGGFGECLPNHNNYVELDKAKVDAWGIPTLKIHCGWSENELALRKDMAISAAEMLAAVGGREIEPFERNDPPGFAIHEMGTARMGRDPKTSILNSFNQAHDVKNLFITDGSAMVSSSCVNPSLTYMALTARACDYAVRQMKKGEL